MIKNFKWQLPALVVAASGLFMASCSEPDSVGIEVQPASDQVQVYYTDTITIEANTVREDSLRSDEGVATLNLAGSYTDPVFGFSRAYFYSQVRLPNNNTSFSFGTDPGLDSAVLTLAYADYYGDTLTPMNFIVERLTETLLLDSNYYTTNVRTTGEELFNGSVNIYPKTGVSVSGGVKDPHLRLLLNGTFFTDNFMGTDDVSILADNAAFINFFNGIKVSTTDVTTAGSGNIAAFNLTAAMTKLTLYYHNTTGTGLTANFEINSQCPRFNHFDHDYSSAAFGNVFPLNGNDKIYIQSMAGLKARLKFPTIKSLNDSGSVSVNKAELVLPVTENSVYRNHSSLLVLGVDEKGAETLIPDILESASYYGGNYSSAENNIKFNITRYIQKILSGVTVTDYGLSLISSGGAVNGYRSVILGPLSGSNKMQLRITYSKLN
jgi:hypothetical protein